MRTLLVELTLPFAALFEECLRRHLRLLPPEQALDLEVELRELGLDSMGALSLIQDLEQSLGVRFSDDLLVEDTFKTGARLLEAVRGLKAG